MQSTGQMLLLLHKHFVMIKEKLDNERMEQLSHHVLSDCKDEKLSARDE